MSSILKPLWRDLADQCRADPAKAIGEMRAVCDSGPGDPMQWSVTGSPGSNVQMVIGNHPALGGDGSAPCPGELVTMAIAACMDGTIRMLADLMEMNLQRIRVEVVNRGDFRSLLRIDDVNIPGPTGFTMTVEVEASGETDERLAKLRSAAEGSAVLNAMRGETPVEVRWA